MHACIEEEEMGDERCEMGLENLVDEQNLEKNQCSRSSNTHESNNNTNTNTDTNNNNDKKQEFLQITPNIIHHFSTNNHENVDQFLQISTATTTSSSSATTPTNNNNIPSHFLSSATPIQPPPTAAVAKNSNTTTNQNFYAKGCSKNNISSSTSTSTSTSTGNNNNNHSNKEQDRFLPIANVGRIMKKFIPGNGKISKDAKETVQECVSEFISFVTGEASDKCQREKRKTINGDDIIWAITTLGFEDYVAPLKHYLNKYRELEGEKLNVPKQQQRNHNDHHHHQQHHQKPNMPNYHCHNNVYSSSTSLPSFVPNDQQFPLPFPQTSNIQTRLPQHEHIDSVGNW